MAVLHHEKNQGKGAALRTGIAKATVSLSAGYLVAAAVNYWRSIRLLFRHQAKWKMFQEIVIFILLISIVGYFPVVGKGYRHGNRIGFEFHWSKVSGLS